MRTQILNILKLVFIRVLLVQMEEHPVMLMVEFGFS